MAELAFNANGETYDLPATVTTWRVRRLKPRGAPELVYGRHGRPLTIAVDATIEDLSDAVSGVTGRYRLDPCSDDGKVIENLPPAYVHVVTPDRVEEPAALVAHADRDSVLREAMRHNTELARAVIDKFPEMMRAAADLIAAADGAGITARRPPVLELPGGDEDDDGEPTEAVVTPSVGFDLNALVAQVVPVLIENLMSGKMGIPGLASMFDWRKAVPANANGLDTKSSAKSAHNALTVRAAAPDLAAMPMLDATNMAHVVAIQAALTPKEVAYVQEVARELASAELRGWLEKLGKLSVPAAVEMIRALIAGDGKIGGTP